MSGLVFINLLPSFLLVIVVQYVEGYGFDGLHELRDVGVTQPLLGHHLALPLRVVPLFVDSGDELVGEVADEEVEHLAGAVDVGRVVVALHGGCIKFLIPPPRVYQACWGITLCCEEGKGLSWLWGRISHGINGKGKPYHLPYNILLLGRISSGEKGKRKIILGKKIKIFKKMGVGKKIEL